MQLWYAHPPASQPRKHEREFARVITKRLLAACAGVPESGVQIGHDPNGRPEVIGPPSARQIQFSVSHTREMVACAATVNRCVGVDAELIRHDRTLLDVAEARFNRGEIRSLQGLKEPERYRRFLELWTLKEAYAKARGRGVASVLAGAAFEVENGRVEARFGTELQDTPSRWSFALHDIGPRHVLATAVSGGTAEEAPAEYYVTLVKDLSL